MEDVTASSHGLSPALRAQGDRIRDWVAVVVLLGVALSVLSVLLMWIWTDWGWLGLTFSLFMTAFGVWHAENDVRDEPRGLSAVEGSTKPEDVNT